MTQLLVAGKPRPEYYAPTFFGEPVMSGLPDSSVKAGYPSIEPWWTSSPHRLLDSLFPGVSFVRIATDARETDVPFILNYGILLEDSTMLELDQLNRLFKLHGFQFDTAQAPLMAKVAILVAYFDREPQPESVLAGKRRLVSWTESRSRPLPKNDTAFPAITFHSLVPGTRKLPVARQPWGIWVDCTIDGIRDRRFVEFGESKGRVYPSMILDRGTSMRFLPE